MTQPRRGYILIMTLVLLAIAAGLLAGVARRSIDAAAVANRQTEALQRRWAHRSAETVILPHAETLLRQAEEEQRKPVRRLPIEVSLDDIHLSLVIADEQARASVNYLYQRGETVGLRESIRALLGKHPEQMDLAIRPTQRSDDTRPFASFGQVFSRPDPARLLGDSQPTSEQGPTDALTCWGNGRLHWRRASAEVMKAYLEPHLTHSEIEMLRRLRQDRRVFTLSQALDRLGVDDATRSVVESVLTNESNCHSLWQVARLNGRTGYRLQVRDGTNGSGDLHTLEW